MAALARSASASTSPPNSATGTMGITVSSCVVSSCAETTPPCHVDAFVKLPEDSVLKVLNLLDHTKSQTASTVLDALFSVFACKGIRLRRVARS